MGTAVRPRPAGAPPVAVEPTTPQPLAEPTHQEIEDRDLLLTRQKPPKKSRSAPGAMPKKPGSAGVPTRPSVPANDAPKWLAGRTKPVPFTDAAEEKSYQTFLTRYGLADWQERRDRFREGPLTQKERRFLERLPSGTAQEGPEEAARVVAPAPIQKQPPPDPIVRTIHYSSGKPETVSARSWMVADLATSLEVNDGIPYLDSVAYFGKVGILDLNTGKPLSDTALAERYERLGSQEYYVLRESEVRDLGGFSKLRRQSADEVLQKLLDAGAALSDLSEKERALLEQLWSPTELAAIFGDGSGITDKERALIVREMPIANTVMPAIDVVLDSTLDHNGAFYRSVYDGDTKLVTSIPQRSTPLPSQLYTGDGAPLVDLSRSLVLRTHGNANGFAGVRSTAEAARIVAKAIVASKRPIDNVVLESCSQADRREFSLMTNGLEFQRALAKELSAAGYRIEVIAASEPGLLSGRANTDGVYTEDGKTLAKMEPPRVRLPVELYPTEALFLGGASVVVAGSAVAGGAIVYLLTRDTPPEEEKYEI